MWVRSRVAPWTFEETMSMGEHQVLNKFDKKKIWVARDCIEKLQSHAGATRNLRRATLVREGTGEVGL